MQLYNGPVHRFLDAHVKKNLADAAQVTQQVIEQAWAWGEWQPLDETASYQRVERCVDALIAAGFPSERREI